MREALSTIHQLLGQDLQALEGREERAPDGLRERVVHPNEGRRIVDTDVSDIQTLEMVVSRARWKAAACRLASDKRAASENDEDVPPELRRLEDGLRQRKESLEDCFAWMLDSPRPLPPEELLLQIAACYDTVALAAEVTLELHKEDALSPAPPSELLYLLAECQSSLLAGLNQVELRNDSDQRDLFLWLKEQTTRHRIYVDRHMRLDDPADHTACEERAARVRALAQELSERNKARLERDKLIAKMRYHVQKMMDAGSGSTSDWDSLVTAVTRWSELGFASTDRALHETLEPLAEELAAGRELPEPVQRVLTAELKPLRTERTEDQSEAAMEESRALLAGKRVVLFGKAEIANAGDPIAEALGLGQMRFVELEETGAPSLIEPALDDEGVDIVMIAMRLPMDDYTWFKQACMDREKPFVRLPGGVEPHQVAHQVIRQVGWRLRSRDRSPA
ncbi:MAG: hypothetical protein GY711_05065 [bacterium]|nr:hypothetical protein [bacterium]